MPHTWKLKLHALFCRQRQYLHSMRRQYFTNKNVIHVKVRLNAFEHLNKSNYPSEILKIFCVILLSGALPAEWRRGPWSWGWPQWSARGPSSRTRLQRGSFFQCAVRLVIALSGHPVESALLVCPKHSVGRGKLKKETNKSSIWNSWKRALWLRTRAARSGRAQPAVMSCGRNDQASYGEKETFN